MDLLALLEAAQAAQMSAYTETLAAYRAERGSATAEVRFVLEPGSGIHRDLDTADLVVQSPAGEPEVVEIPLTSIPLDPPEQFQSGALALTIYALAWGEVQMRCDSGAAPEALDRWFETWLDPDNTRRVVGQDFAGVLHSASFHQALDWFITTVDFGSAPVAAFVALTLLFEASGATECSIDTAHG